MSVDVLEPPADFDRQVPVISSEPVPACPVCSARERERFASGFDYEIKTCRNRWDLWRCSSCSCVWLDPRPAVAELGVIYPPTYYAYEIEKNVSVLSLKAKELLDRFKFSAILRKAGREPRTYLDIGCGNGRYLELFAKRGIARQSIYGLELSEAKIADLRARGFNAHYRRVEECVEVPQGSIDLATMFHVIEHVADPREVVRRIGSWLSEDGLLAVETPNIDSIDARLFERTYWGGYHIPRHWTLFNEQSLRRLFEDAGLEVISVSYQTGHSFWMYSFHHLLKYNSRWPLPKLANWFDPLRGVPFLAAFTAFDILRRTLGFRTSAMLIIARKRRPLRAGSGPES